MENRLDICRACGGKAAHAFDGTLRGTHHVSYFHCEDCGFLQTEAPYWLEEAYSESINANDTGLVRRNLWLSGVSALIMSILLSRGATGVDYGGGYGLFVRLMRDKGFRFFWEDPRTENLFAKGYEYVPGERVDLVTCFEAFEHFEKPAEELDKMLQRGRNILFSTELLPEPVPAAHEWWYYDLENGQHIAFYTRETLERLSERHKLYLSSAWSVHMFSEFKVAAPVFKALVGAGRLGLDKLLYPWLRAQVRRMQAQ